MARLLLLAPVAVWSACTPVVAGQGGLDTGSLPDVGVTDGDDGGGDGTDADDSSDGDGDDGADGDDGPDLPFDVDCDALPETPTFSQVLDHARGYHGLLFDDEGHLIGWDGRDAFVKATYTGDLTPWVPGVWNSDQMVWADDGGFYYTDSYEGTVVQVSPEGGRSVLASGMEYPYGLMWGPDGKLWVADGNILRVDPATGDIESLYRYESGGGWYTHSLGFNLDCTRLFFGTIGSGEVMVMELDAGLNPVGSVSLFARTRGGWHDAMEMDACGNLYVPDYYSGGLNRISASGEVEEIIERSDTQYGHGVAWGNGVGGWRQDAIYLPQPYNGNRVRELVIGVPDGRFVRTWNGEAFHR